MRKHNVALEVSNLTKKYNDFIAIDHVNFTVFNGEFLGLLGPNGAGKTTLVKIISAAIKPSEGIITINGHKIHEEPGEVKKSIGVVSHNSYLYEELTAYENLQFFAKIYDIPSKEIDERITWALESVNLQHRSQDAVSTFSRGMKQRLSIARAMMHHPKLLILDEPTVGLDLQSKNVFYDLIKEINKSGSTIFLTTHHILEAETLCDRIIILSRGKIALEGKIASIKEQYLNMTFEDIYLEVTKSK